jgi:stress-induced morphogen
MKPDDIEIRLKTHFPGADVAVIDLTGTEDHYEVRVVSAAFQGRSRLEQQRQVMAALAAELKSGEVHALTIKTMTK